MEKFKASAPKRDALTERKKAVDSAIQGITTYENRHAATSLLEEASVSKAAETSAEEAAVQAELNEFGTVEQELESVEDARDKEDKRLGIALAELNEFGTVEQELESVEN